jgi:hypothetical protein
MKYHRGLLFWGLALITGGAVALAAQQNYLDRDLLAGAWRLWPLILVAIGLSILLSRTPAAIVGTVVAALILGTAGGALIAVGPGSFSCGGAAPTNLTTRQGTFGDSASVQLDFNCGTLNVSMDDADGWTVASGQRNGTPAKITADSDSLEVRTSNIDTNWFDQGRQRWNVTLPTSTSYELLEIMPNAADTKIDLGDGTFTIVSVHPNAGSIFLDLTDAQVDEIDLSLNAGSASILVAEGSVVSGSLSVNAGSIELCTDGALAIHLTLAENITFSHNLAESDLGRDGDTWSYVPSYPPGAVVSLVDLHIAGNAGSFTLNPEGGCS